MYNYSNRGMSDIFTIKEVENGWLVYVFYEDDEDEGLDNKVEDTVEGMFAATAALEPLTKAFSKIFTRNIDEDIGDDWKHANEDEEESDTKDSINVEEVRSAVSGAVNKVRLSRKPKGENGPTIYCFTNHKELVEFIGGLLNDLYSDPSPVDIQRGDAVQD